MEKIRNFIKKIVFDAVREALPAKEEPKIEEPAFNRLLRGLKIREREEYPKDEYADICKAAYDVLKFGQLETIKKHLINDVISDAIRNSESMELIMFNRATISGIEIFFDELKALSNSYEVDMQERRSKVEDTLEELL